MLELTRIPANVQAVLDGLERKTTQDFSELIQLDDGVPMRRPRSRPYDVLEGNVVVDEATFADIKKAQIGIYTGTYRGTELTLAPISSRIVGQTLEGGRLTFDLEIKIRVLQV